MLMNAIGRCYPELFPKQPLEGEQGESCRRCQRICWRIHWRRWSPAQCYSCSQIDSGSNCDCSCASTSTTQQYTRSAPRSCYVYKCCIYTYPWACCYECDWAFS